MLKPYIIKLKQMKLVTFWNLFLGVVNIPLNIIVTSSLANAVSSIANNNYVLCIQHTITFTFFSLVLLLFSIFKKSYILKLTSKAKQAYRQSLYSRFMQGTLFLHKSEPNTYSTIFRRDSEQISTFYAEILPAFVTAVIGFFVYSFYVCFFLNSGVFLICIVILGLLNLLQPIILEKFLIKNFIAADCAESNLAQHLTSGREGFSTLKLLNLHKWYMECYLQKQKAYWTTGVYASASGTFNTAMGDINKFLQTLGLVSILGWAILKQAITFDIAMQIYILSTNIYAYIKTIAHIKKDSATYRAASEQIKKYLSLNGLVNKDVFSNTYTSQTLCVSNLYYETNNRVLIKNSSFSLFTGEKCLLQGANGTGKSTLLALIMGELPVNSGQIIVNGSIVDSNAKYLQNEISYCPQSIPALHCTPLELYTSALKVQSNLSETLLYEYANDLGLSHKEFEMPINTLSGGTQKKVILCMALAKQTPLLLLDEPEAMLDQRALKALIKIIQIQNRTILISTHNSIYEDIVHSSIQFKEQQLLKTILSTTTFKEEN